MNKTGRVTEHQHPVMTQVHQTRRGGPQIAARRPTDHSRRSADVIRGDRRLMDTESLPNIL